MDTTSSSTPADPIHSRIRVPFFLPIDRILPKILTAFENGAAIVEVAGFPLKVFCVRESAMVGAILQHKPVGETKLQKLLPRVKRVMGDGGYILSGGTVWRERRRQVQEGFRREYQQQYAALVTQIAEIMLERWKPQ